MGPDGFLGEVWFLAALGVEEFERIRQSGDYHDAEAGEILAPPAWQGLLSGGEILDVTGFLGTASIAGTTLATIRRGDGHAVLAALHETMRAFGREQQSVLELVPALLELSGQLEALQARGVTVLRPACDLRTLNPA